MVKICTLHVSVSCIVGDDNDDEDMYLHDEGLGNKSRRTTSDPTKMDPLYIYENEGDETVDTSLGDSELVMNQGEMQSRQLADMGKIITKLEEAVRHAREFHLFHSDKITLSLVEASREISLLHRSICGGINANISAAIQRSRRFIRKQYHLCAQLEKSTHNPAVYILRSALNRLVTDVSFAEGNIDEFEQR